MFAICISGEILVERKFMTTTEYIKLKVEEKTHSYAKVYSSLLNDEFQRKRSYASLVALYSFVDLLEQSQHTVQKAMTLFKNPLLNEEFEISDFYVNAWHIDVRVVTGGNAVLVPKVHFDNDIVPDFYVVVKANPTLTNLELVGIVDTKNMEKESFDSKYEAIPFTSLIDYNSFLKKIEVEKTCEHDEGDHELFRSSYLALLDNNIDTETKNKVIRHLFKCTLCRTEFCCFTGFEMVCCNISKYPDVLEDHTLGFVGAQNAEDTKYEGKEETIYIGSDTNTPDEIKIPNASNNVAEEKENHSNDNEDNQELSIDDILDEVAIDTSVIYTGETAELIFEKDETEGNEDLKAISDDLFLDEPPKSQESTSTEGDLQIITDDEENSSLEEDNIEIITDEETKIIESVENIELLTEETKKTLEDEDILILDDDKVEELEIVDIEEDESPIIEETEKLEEIVKTEEIEETEEIDEKIEKTEDKIDEIYPSDEEFIINDDEESLEIIEDEIIDEATMLSQEEPVQKVIVDYDENGEPIYSYINDIEKEKDSSEETDILLEDNDDDNNELKEDDDFLDYTDDEETVSEIEDISDKHTEEDDDEEYESVYADERDDINQNNQVNDVQEDIEYNDDEPLEYYDEDEEVEQEPSIIDDILYKNDNVIDDNKENIVQTVQYDGNNEEDISRAEQEENETINDETNEEEDDEDMIDYKDEDFNTEEDGEYEDYDLEDHLPDEQVKKSSSLLPVIISIVVLLGLIGGIFLFLSKNKETQEDPSFETFNENVIETAENQAVNDMFEEPIAPEQQSENLPVQQENQTQTETVVNNDANTDIQQEQTQQTEPVENVSMPKLTESDLIKPVERKSNGDVNKTIVNAFAVNASPVSLRALNWFCASELFSDINFKNYLQTIDNSLKQNLKNNFMNLVENSPKDSVAAKFAIDNRGNLKKVIISESSGSEEIDNVVLQSINETFEREKSQILNDNELKQDMYYLKVVIKL